MKNKHPNIQINKVGSRARGDFGRDSDLDIRFYFPSGNPQRAAFYPKLVALLEDKLPDINGEKIVYSVGTDGNIVKARPVKGGKVDIVLVQEMNF